ncbi:MAG: GyrI-like domain-containing protein [Pseudomonadales bacterium]|nr:GyrI-like domain-containing protein [Pseudomonadales bacterium]
MGSFQRYDQPRPYGAVVRSGPFPLVLETIPAALLAVRTALAQGGHAPAGPALVRYGLIAMEGVMTIEIGYPITLASASGLETSLRLGTLPPGRYAERVVKGPYEGLQAGTAAFIAWGEEAGVRWAKEGASGDCWTARTEHYEVGPDSTADPSQWRTRLSFLLAS